MTTTSTDNEKTYAWTVEGEVTSGTLDKYAHDFENAHYSGMEVSHALWDGREIHTATIRWQATTEDLYMPFDVVVGSDIASGRIDGRA